MPSVGCGESYFFSIEDSERNRKDDASGNCRAVSLWRRSPDMPGELSRLRWMEKAVQRLFVKKQEGEGLVITECVKVTSFFW